MQMLGVTEHTLNTYGAVSGETAKAMVMGTLEKSGADAAVSVTGLAGPDGDGSGIPIGTVWIGAMLRSGAELVQKFHFSGSRNDVRTQAARKTLEKITELL
jgi:PncC family amidohydrolase